MKLAKIYCTWDLNIHLRHEKQIEIWVDRIPTEPIDDEHIKIVVLIEPPEVYNLTQTVISEYKKKYDFLLTHNQRLINELPDAFLYEFGGCWTKDYVFGGKRYGVSTIVGGKRMTHGHIFRQNLWARQNEITIPKKFWMSGDFGGIANLDNNPVLGKVKSLAFEEQFHICIENVSRLNWFTEKLIDCFYTKSIPLYYGCPNIGDWFDTKGMFIINNVNEIVNVANSLTPDDYEKMLPFVEKNYEESKKYMDVGENIRRSILKNIFKET